MAAGTHCITSSEPSAPPAHRRSPLDLDLAVCVPTSRRHQTTVRRGGFDNHDAAETALRRLLEGKTGGLHADPNQSADDYLNTWLAAKALVLKPTTMARYRDYAHNDLAPAFGTLKLDELGHRHIAAFVTGELAAGLGKTPSTAAWPPSPVLSVTRSASIASPTTHQSPGTSPATVARAADLDRGRACAPPISLRCVVFPTLAPRSGPQARCNKAT